MRSLHEVMEARDVAFPITDDDVADGEVAHFLADVDDIFGKLGAMDFQLSSAELEAFARECEPRGADELARRRAAFLRAASEALELAREL